MCALSNGDTADKLVWPLTIPKPPYFLHLATPLIFP